MWEQMWKSEYTYCVFSFFPPQIFADHPKPTNSSASLKGGTHQPRTARAKPTTIGIRHKAIHCPSGPQAKGAKCAGLRLEKQIEKNKNIFLGIWGSGDIGVWGCPNDTWISPQVNLLYADSPGCGQSCQRKPAHLDWNTKPMVY